MFSTIFPRFDDLTLFVICYLLFLSSDQEGGGEFTLEKMIKIIHAEVFLMVTRDFSDELEWTTEAKTKLKNIPYFVRSQARQRIEQMAREEELQVVTPDLVEKARLEFGQ